MISFIRQLLSRWARFIYRRPLLIMAVCFLVGGCSLWLTLTRLTVVNQINSLIRQTSPALQNYLKYKAEFGIDEDYNIIIRSADPERNREVADRIGNSLRAMQPEVRNVVSKFDFSRMTPRFLLFLDKTKLLEIENQLKDTSSVLREQNVHFDLNSMLSQVDKYDDKFLRKKDNWKEFKPFIDQFIHLLNTLADELEGKNEAQKPKSVVHPNLKMQASHEAQGQLDDYYQKIRENEYVSFDEGRLIMVSAAPGKFSDGASPYSATILKIRSMLQSIKTKNSDVTITLTGEPVLEDDELQTSSNDSVKAGLLAFVLVAVLFLISYRQMARPLLALLVLLVGVSMSLGFAVITIGHLNLISQSFVAMIIGLGIDFSIQIMGRYEEELSLGRGVQEALEQTLQHTGLAIITGGSTTAAAFFTMCYNDFIGLAEFGVIAGGGILICLSLSLSLLPALYVWRDRSRDPDTLRQKLKPAAVNGDTWFNRTLVRFPVSVLFLAAGLSWFSVQQLSKISFDYNLLNMQNPNLESVREIHNLINTPESGVIFGVSIADNLEDARARILKFKALPSVQGTRSLTDLFPADVDEKLVIMRRIVESLHGLNLKPDVRAQIDVVRARTQLTEILAGSKSGLIQAQKFVILDSRARDGVEVLSKLIPPLERSLAAMNKLSQEEIGRHLYRYQLKNLDVMRRNLEWISGLMTDRGILPQDLPTEILHHFQSPNGKILIEIIPKEDVWEHDPNVRFVQELRTVDPKVTGTPVQNYEYINLLRTSYVQASKYALIAIVIIILLHFRHPGYALLAILPLGLAILWTMGWMGYAHQPFNPANVVTLPLVIGIGVAYGIYTVDRYREDKAMKLFSNSTGKAILLSALTATFGFGSMVISEYRGLYSLGLLMGVGVGFCLITSLFVLPQILHLLDMVRNRFQPKKEDAAVTKDPTGTN